MSAEPATISLGDTIRQAMSSPEPAPVEAPAPETPGDTPAPVETPAAEPETPEQPSESVATEALLTEAEEAAIAKLDPKEQLKALRRAYSDKTGKLSQETKAIRGLISSLQSDPRGTLQQIADQYGFQIAEKPNGSTQASAQAVTDAADVLQTTLEKVLLGELPATAAAQVMRDEMKRVAEAALKPVQDWQQTTIQETAAKQVQAAMETFSAKHKDWKQYEPAMMKMAERFQPAEGSMDEVEYLEALYTLATANAKTADVTQKVVDRINASAQKAEASAPGVPPGRVTPTAPTNVSDKGYLQSAIRAGMRGELWES